MTELIPTENEVVREIQSYYAHFALLSLFRDCIKLGIFDALPRDVTQFTTIEELSSKLDVNEETLFRCLRCLSSRGYTCQSSLNVGIKDVNYKDKMFSH